MPENDDSGPVFRRGPGGLWAEFGNGAGPPGDELEFDEPENLYQPDFVFYVDDGQHYHRGECVLLPDVVRRTTRDLAEGRGLTPCPKCRP